LVEGCKKLDQKVVNGCWLALQHKTNNQSIFIQPTT